MTRANDSNAFLRNTAGPVIQRVYEYVAIRDWFTCQRCGRCAWDIAHILPKGRYPELKYEPKNMVALCRKCHKETETAEGRAELLALMQERHGYGYPEPQYQRYLEGGESEDEDRGA